jgi:hypothetical protein
MASTARVEMMEECPSDRPRPVVIAWFALALGTTLLLTNFFRFVDRYAVNLLFIDQWDLYGVFTTRATAWQLFRWTHGPHRQGIAFLLTRLVAEHTAWNTRGESFLVAGLIAAAMVVALVLKWRLLHRLGPFDLIVPLIFLTTAQYDTLVLVPNAAHSAAPLLLILISALVVTWDHPARAPLLLVLELLTIHTGFGIFAGFVFVALLAVEAWKAFRHTDFRRCRSILLLLACAVAVLGTFFIHYHPGTAADCFSLLDPQWAFYASFVSLMLGAFGGFLLGNTPVTSALMSTGITVCTLWVLFRACRRQFAAHSIDDDRRTLIIVGLGLFSLAFAAFTAIGRICFSPAYGQSSRYMTLLIPAALAIDLEVTAIRNVRSRTAATLLLAAIVLHGYLPPTVPVTHPVAVQAEQKKRWRDCYLSTLNRARCDAVTGLRVHATEWDPELDRQLLYIRVHHLNIFAKLTPDSRALPPAAAR